MNDRLCGIIKKIREGDDAEEMNVLASEILELISWAIPTLPDTANMLELMTKRNRTLLLLLVELANLAQTKAVFLKLKERGNPPPSPERWLKSS